MKRSLVVFFLSFVVSLLNAQTIDTMYVDDSDGSPLFQTESFVDTWIDASYGWLGTSKVLMRNSSESYGHNATWTPSISQPGYYAVAHYLPTTSNSRNHVLWLVAPFGSSPDSMYYNQNTNSGSWITMGVYYLLDGSFVKVIDDSTSTTGYTFRADAVRFISAQNTPDLEMEYRDLNNITNIDFAETNIGGGKDVTLDIWNIGDQILTVTNIVGTTGVFTVTDPDLPFDVQPRSKTTITIRFTPLSEKIYADTLTLSCNDPKEPEAIIAVSGEGTQVTVYVNNDDGPPYYMEHIGTWNTSNGAAQCPGIDNPTSRWIHYGTVGARVEFKPDIPLDGLYSVYYIGPATQNASVHALHEIHPFGGSVDSVWIDQNTNSGCDPKYLGTYSFIAGDLSSVYSVVDGTASGIYAHRADIIKFVSVPDRPKILLNNSYHEFEDIKIDSTAFWTCTINNVGGEVLTIENATLNSDFFSIVQPASFPVNVNPLDSTNIVIGFTPAEITSYRDTLVIYSNDLDYPEETVILDGNGIGIQLIFDNSNELIFASGPTDTTWQVSTSTSGIGPTSLFTDKQANPDAWCTWTITAPEELEYDIYMSSVPSSSVWTSTICPVIIQSAFYNDTLIVDQTTTSSSNLWIYLGRYLIDPNLPVTVKVQNDTLITFGEDGIPNTEDDGGMVIRADAIKIEEPAVGIDVTGENALPTVYRLEQNYPNPFNPVTHISFSLPRRSQVELSVYNLLGQRVKKLYMGEAAAGSYEVIWDGKNEAGNPVSSGLYIYQLRTEKYTLSRKMLFLK